MWKYLLPLAAFFACHKKVTPPAPEPEEQPIHSFSINIGHRVSGTALTAGVFSYTTAAGYPFSVTSLKYYLSSIHLVRNDGKVFPLESAHYADAFDATTLRMIYPGFAAGTYTAIEFNIGLDSAHNVSYSLPATQQNLNMEWPDPMGGGYHFLKLEGHFTASDGDFGYAMHIGKTGFHVPLHLVRNVVIEDGKDCVLSLIMDVNEWFQSPWKYDFVKDGNYTMGIDSLMRKISDNGKDVFTAE